MKAFLYFITGLLLFSSCKSSRDYLSRGDEDKTLFDIVKRLNKRADDEEARKALAEVYIKANERHLKKISAYRTSKEIGRWDKLNSEYQVLQDMYDVIDQSATASRLVTAKSYQSDLEALKEPAAEDYYQLGERYLDQNNRESAKKAYEAYKKSDKWIKDYRGSKQKMEDAYNSSIVIVVINPVQDNSFFFNTGWGSNGYNYSNEYFQQNLVRDLGGRYASRYPARFYTENEARQDNADPDWVIDLTLRNIDIPRPLLYNYSRNLSKKIEIGKDTSGKPLYKTVYATLNIQRQSFTARAQMDVIITAIAAHRNIANNSYTDSYNWQEEVATYTGDRRALGSNDWALINSHFNLPGKQDILNQLYRNIYPQVKNRITNEVSW